MIGFAAGEMLEELRRINDTAGRPGIVQYVLRNQTKAPSLQLALFMASAASWDDAFRHLDAAIAVSIRHSCNWLSHRSGTACAEAGGSTSACAGWDCCRLCESGAAQAFRFMTTASLRPGSPSIISCTSMRSCPPASSDMIDRCFRTRPSG